jgi:hypothetical protein
LCVSPEPTEQSGQAVINPRRDSVLSSCGQLIDFFLYAHAVTQDQFQPSDYYKMRTIGDHRPWRQTCARPSVDATARSGEPRRRHSFAACVEAPERPRHRPPWRHVTPANCPASSSTATSDSGGARRDDGSPSTRRILTRTSARDEAAA